MISFRGGFHGRTLLALSLTGSVQPYKQDFGPYATEIYQTPFPYAYRGWTTETAMADLESLLESEVSPKRVAAIVIEPVLGEGGFVPAPLDFMRKLRELCDRHGMLLIADEIQTGFGRTGKFFAIEHSGVQPDLITVAKSLAAGFPLSGVVGRAEVMDAPDPGGLGGTYAGNPVACAAGLAVMDIMSDEKLPERAARIGVSDNRLSSAESFEGDVAIVLVQNTVVDSEAVRIQPNLLFMCDASKHLDPGSKRRGLNARRQGFGIWSVHLAAQNQLQISRDLVECFNNKMLALHWVDASRIKNVFVKAPRTEILVFQRGIERGGRNVVKS